MRALPADGLAIILYHAPLPDLVARERAPRIDLFCAGHVHGGQVALPGYGALITLSRFGKRLESGLYPDAEGFRFPLYVSRGTGMEGGSTPRVRFASGPEVALTELSRRREGDDGPSTPWPLASYRQNSSPRWHSGRLRAHIPQLRAIREARPGRGAKGRLLGTLGRRELRAMWGHDPRSPRVPRWRFRGDAARGYPRS